MIVKVCGMRDPDNIRAVAEAGADWMGFIFYPLFRPGFHPFAGCDLPCRRVCQ